MLGHRGRRGDLCGDLLARSVHRGGHLRRWSESESQRDLGRDERGGECGGERRSCWRLVLARRPAELARPVVWRLRAVAGRHGCGGAAPTAAGASSASAGVGQTAARGFACVGCDDGGKFERQSPERLSTPWRLWRVGFVRRFQTKERKGKHAEFIRSRGRFRRLRTRWIEEQVQSRNRSFISATGRNVIHRYSSESATGRQWRSGCSCCRRRLGLWRLSLSAYVPN